MKIVATLVTFGAMFSSAFAQQTPAQQRMVIMVSLDGFPGYALDDPKLPIPTLRHLMQQGVSARMTPVNPTVTWPNHTTMVTGVRSDQHGLFANGMIARTGAWPPVKVEPMVDKEKLVHAVTVYDAAFKADSPPRRWIGWRSTVRPPSPGHSMNGHRRMGPWNKRWSARA